MQLSHLDLQQLELLDVSSLQLVHLNSQLFVDFVQIFDLFPV